MDALSKREQKKEMRNIIKKVNHKTREVLLSLAASFLIAAREYEQTMKTLKVISISSKDVFGNK